MDTMKLGKLTLAMTNVIKIDQNWAALEKNNSGAWVYHMTDANADTGWQVLSQRELDYILNEIE